MARVKNAFHDEICEAAALRELGAEECAWLRDNGSGPTGGDANAAQGEAPQSGLRADEGIAQPGGNHEQ